MSKQPLVSILIPVYNRETLVGSCIQSAIDQTIEDIEIIIVDNASTDGTWKVCQQYALQDSRIRIFRNKENIGPVKNWQRCIEEARGKYGKILFSDDLIRPQFLEVTLPFLKDDSCAFVFSSACIGESEWIGNKAYNYSKGNVIVSVDKYFKDLFIIERDLPLSPGCALFRLNDIRKNLIINLESPTILDFNDHGAGPDLLIFLITAIEYEKIAYVSDELAFFRSHPGSITISDKNAYLQKCYLYAKIWFLNKYYNCLLDEVLISKWFKSCRKAKKIINFNDFISHYLFIEKKFSFRLLIQTLIKFRYMKLSYKIRQILRNK